MADQMLDHVPLLVSAVCAASAQTYWSYGGYGPQARDYCGAPYDGGGRNMGMAAAINTAVVRARAMPAKRRRRQSA